MGHPNFFGCLAYDASKSVAEEKLGLPTLGELPVADDVSANDVSAKSIVLALSAPGSVGPGGKTSKISFGPLAVGL